MAVRKNIAQDFTLGADAHEVCDTNVFVGSIQSDITTNGIPVRRMILRKNKTAVWNMMDNATIHHVLQDSGILVQNKKVLTDSVLVIRDSLNTDTTIQVYWKDSLTATARLSYGILSEKQWIGGRDTTHVWNNGKPRHNITVNKSAGMVFNYDPLLIQSRLDVVDGEFRVQAVDDTVTSDTIRLTTVDSVVLGVVHLTGSNAVLLISDSTKIRWLPGAVILSDSCDPLITNQTAVPLPDQFEPPTGPFSYTPNAVVVEQDSAMTPMILTNDGCLWDSIKVSPALPAGITLNTSNGTISGTPTVASPATVYTITGYNNSGAGLSSDSTTVTITVTGHGFIPAIQNRMRRRGPGELMIGTF